MILNITRNYHDNGRMYLLKYNKKSREQISSQYDEDVKKYGNIFLVSLYNLICINDIIIGLVTDAFSHVSKTALYKHDVKQKIGEVNKLLKAYEIYINKLVSKYSDNFADANDAFYTDDLAYSIELLRLLFKQELDKKNIEYSNELSWLEIARVMLEYSVICNKKREQELNEVTKRHNKYFDVLNIEHIYRTYEQIFHHIKLNRSINLNTPQCLAMFNKIDRMCLEQERIQNTINKMSKEIE